MQDFEERLIRGSTLRSLAKATLHALQSSLKANLGSALRELYSRVMKAAAKTPMETLSFKPNWNRLQRIVGVLKRRKLSMNPHNSQTHP